MNEAERHKLEKYWNKNNKNENKVLELERLSFNALSKETFYKKRHIVLTENEEGQGIFVKYVITDFPEWALSRISICYQLTTSEFHWSDDDGYFVVYTADDMLHWFNNTLSIITQFSFDKLIEGPIYITATVVFNLNRGIYEFSDKKI